MEDENHFNNMCHCGNSTTLLCHRGQTSPRLEWNERMHKIKNPLALERSYP